MRACLPLALRVPGIARDTPARNPCEGRDDRSDGADPPATPEEADRPRRVPARLRRDGNDLVGLVEPLAPHLPRTRSRHRTHRSACPGSPFGYQWFPIPWLDGAPKSVARGQAAAAFATLDGWLDAEQRATPAGRTVLVGFSQGTMMALQVGLRRRTPLAGIVGFSGRLLDPETLPGGSPRGRRCCWCMATRIRWCRTPASTRPSAC